MNIKRCVKCGKPSRADAAYCKACGHTFSVQKPGPAKLSTPPASPHRAGHSSGLHPEDQPYQSTFMAALRPPVPVVLSPSPLTYPSERVPTPSNPHATWVPKSDRTATDHLDRVDDVEQEEPDEFIQPTSPLPASSNPKAVWVPKSERVKSEGEAPARGLPSTPTPPLPLHDPLRGAVGTGMDGRRRVSSSPDFPPLQAAFQYSHVPRKPRMQDRAVPILLTISCLLFLVATSLLAFLFLSKRHEPLTKLTLTAMPNSLRVNDTFMLTGTGFGTGDPLRFSRDKNIPILDGSHLTDALGNFTVPITVSSLWEPGSHTIHVADDLQQLAASTQIIIEAPSAAPPKLRLASLHIDFGTGDSQQPVTLMNAGGGQLTWQASCDQNWLTVKPNKGTFSGSTLVYLIVKRGSLPPGPYSGHVTFTQQGSTALSSTLSVTMSIKAAKAPAASFQGGANQEVSATLNAVAPPNLAVSPISLNLQAAQGQTSVGQISIQDSGGQPLDWTVNTGANWLSVSTTSGHLNPSETQSITVTANAGGLAVNSYQGPLTFTYGTSTQQVTVKLTVIQPPMPAISVQPATLVFNATQGINPPAQSFTITNIGNAPLNWATTKDANGTTYVATSVSSGTIAPAKNVTITVTPKVASAGPGPITALITVFDSDKGSTVPKQQVSVTINISSAAIINASPNDMVFNEGGGVTSQEELLYIVNTGSAPLNWSLVQGSQTPASWLSFDSNSGMIAAGTTFTVNVTCDSSQLAPGTTYTATLVVSDTDPNSPVLSQTITVTLIVGS